jgi:cytochrome c oxidase assembly factor CtaG
VLSWNLDPAVVLALVALAAGYYALIGPLRVRYAWGEAATRSQIGYFVAGMAALTLTLVSPLETLGRTSLFSAHMLQVMLLNTLVGPLLLLGLPEWVARRATRWLPVTGEGSTLVLWVVAALLFNGAFLFWHAGQFYEAGLRNEAIHDLESITLLLTGTVRWWPLLTPERRDLRLASPLQILYVLLESLPVDIFGIVLIFATKPLYPTYALAPRAFGIPVMLDQQVAGCIALIPGTFLDIILMSIVFFGWFQRMERQQLAEEALAAGERVADAPSVDGG